jgi:hypothetical protein
MVIGRSSFSARSFAASAKPACPAPTITNLPATPCSSSSSSPAGAATGSAAPLGRQQPHGDNSREGSAMPSVRDEKGQMRGILLMEFSLF